MKQSIDPFYALSDPQRRRILQLLTKETLTVNSLAENFDISRPAVSKHIKILHSAGFISMEDIGRERYCILKEDGFHKLQEWIDYFDEFWAKKLKKLEKLLDEKAQRKNN